MYILYTYYTCIYMCMRLVYVVHNIEEKNIVHLMNMYKLEEFIEFLSK